MSHYFTNEDVKSNLKKIKVIVGDKDFYFNTDNGIFSKKGLDFGTRTLIDTVLNLNLEGTMLDVGCGYGVIGIILSSFFPLLTDMVDVNKRAIHLSIKNAKENKVLCNVFESDCYEKIEKKYDYIITNPPIRAGKEIVYKILFNAKYYLNPGGNLLFVINKDQGAKSVVKDLGLKAAVEILNKNKGFYVVKANFN